MLDTVISLFKFPESFGLCLFHPSVQLPAAIVRIEHLQDATDIGDALALVEQLLSTGQLVDDPYGCLAHAFHWASPGRLFAWEALIRASSFLGFTSVRVGSNTATLGETNRIG